MNNYDKAKTIDEIVYVQKMIEGLENNLKDWKKRLKLLKKYCPHSFTSLGLQRMKPAYAQYQYHEMEFSPFIEMQNRKQCVYCGKKIWS